MKSRYYDPAVGRFINADGFASTGQGILGCNMFAYCGNDPVVCSDPSGQREMIDNSDIQCAMAVCCWFAVSSLYAATTSGQSGLEELTYLIYDAFCEINTARIKIQDKAIETIAELVTAKRKGDGNIYSVYYLKDSEGTIRYVGRVKTANLYSRVATHEQVRGLNLAYHVDGLTYEVARALEERGMIEYNTLTKEFPGNMIHGISPTNRKRNLYFF